MTRSDDNHKEMDDGQNDTTTPEPHAVEQAILETILRVQLDSCVARLESGGFAAVRMLRTLTAAPKVPPDIRAEAMLALAALKWTCGLREAAIGEVDAIIAMEGLSAGARVRAFNLRSAFRSEESDWSGAIADCEAARSIPDVSAEQRAMAYCNRGYARSKSGDKDGALADYGVVLDMPEAPADMVAWTLTERGALKADADDIEGGLKDLDAVIGMEDASNDRKAEALSTTT